MLLIIGNIVYYICIAEKYRMKINDIADALVASFFLANKVDI